MKINGVPNSWSELAACETTLKRSDLTVADLRRVSTVAFNILRSSSTDVTEQVKEVALRILAQVEVAEEAMIERDVTLLPELSALDARIMKLALQSRFMDPEAVAEEITALVKDVDAAGEHMIGSSEVMAKLQDLKGRVQDQMFKFVFPGADLTDFSLEMRSITVEG